MTTAALLKEVVQILEDHKGGDIQVLPVQDLTPLTDYMVITTATSYRHAKSLHRHLLELVCKMNLDLVRHKIHDEEDWLLVDFKEIVVHIMQPAARQYYDLEGLWDKQRLQQACSA